MNSEHLHPEGRPFTKDEFVEKIKNDKNFANRFGNLGRIYGAQWRSWKNPSFPKLSKEFNDEFGNKGIDQISELIRLLKETPDSRRMVVNAWAVHDLPKMVLPPCHYGFQVYTRELSMEERLDWLNVNIKNPKGTFISKLPYEHLHSLF
jgi:thymidylate synthase